ncbi:hypothetical protein LCGC14_0537310 [marine sediment metagenome]|uniref:Uncharacterized protein n=1 Tax=marine sediment metagenome TaxID=412755 RepID=A0A0F9UF96_9ZZZZ
MIKLTIQVTDITTVMVLYDVIRVYRSDARDGTYTVIDTVALIAGVSDYVFNDSSGTPDDWYKSTYYNTSNSNESSFSNAVHGTAVIFHDVTYPPEFAFNTEEQVLIRKIRRYIGDLRGLGRLYIDQETGEFCSNILDDNRTVDIADKIWPVYVTVDGSEFTTLTDPVVQGYQYLTFSGTLISGSQTKVIEIWYHTFKFSDRQVYESYGDAMIPPGLTAANVTQDHLVLQAAIDLLQNMYAEDAVDDGATIKDDQTTYDPSPGLKEREKIIMRLQKILDALIKQYMFSELGGVLID